MGFDYKQRGRRYSTPVAQRDYHRSKHGSLNQGLNDKFPNESGSLKQGANADMTFEEKNLPYCMVGPEVKNEPGMWYARAFE